jgi:hypothetical protein
VLARRDRATAATSLPARVDVNPRGDRLTALTAGTDAGGGARGARLAHARRAGAGAPSAARELGSRAPVAFAFQ